MSKSQNQAAGLGIWITGLPASGKSAITAELKPRLEAMGYRVEVLESDDVRRHVTPFPTYSHEEREQFYRSLAYFGSRLVAHGVTVIFDATATKRAYRDLARGLIRRFVEVAVECPLNVCKERDRKGTYRKAERGESVTVPGIHDTYEAPLKPEVRIDSTQLSPPSAAALIVAALRETLSGQ